MGKVKENMYNVVQEKKPQIICKISVIIPAYNMELYLRESLECIFAQSLKEIEIICVDDGSTDRTLDIMLEYAQKDERITVCTKQNTGLSSTRNCGVKQARGEYLYFLDADDLLKPNALEVLYKIAKENNLQVVYFDGVSFSLDERCEKEVEQYKTYYSRKNEYPIVTTGPQLMSQMVKNEEYRVNCGLHMVQANYFRENDLWFEEGILHEDNLYTYRCMLSAERAGYKHEILFLRRFRWNSIMTSKKSFAHTYGYFITHMKMIEFLKTLKLDEQEENAALEIQYRVLQSGRYSFGELDAEEMEKYALLPHEERWYFQAYIGEFVNMKKHLEQKVEDEYQRLTRINESLQKALTEKDELKERLQKAFAEKDELKNRLQKSMENGVNLNVRLQKAFQDKSEIKVKLQAVSKENEERSQEILRLTDEIEGKVRILRKKNKKIKKQSEEISQLKKNLGVKIEKKLRSFVKKDKL